jgi:coproporphyrinogen III oxidase-like Fe-S oxidoreductase
MHWASAMIAPVVDASLVQRYDQRAPRYTSYPTALELSTRVYRGRTAMALPRVRNCALRSAPPLALYLHIPFCECAYCYYCACNKVVTRHDERAAEPTSTRCWKSACTPPRYTRQRVSRCTSVAARPRT